MNAEGKIISTPQYSTLKKYNLSPYLLSCFDEFTDTLPLSRHNKFMNRPIAIYPDIMVDGSVKSLYEVTKNPFHRNVDVEENMFCGSPIPDMDMIFGNINEMKERKYLYDKYQFPIRITDDNCRKYEKRLSDILSLRTSECYDFNRVQTKLNGLKKLAVDSPDVSLDHTLNIEELHIITKTNIPYFKHLKVLVCHHDIEIPYLPTDDTSPHTLELLILPEFYSHSIPKSKEVYYFSS